MIYYILIGAFLAHVSSTYIILRENKEDGFYAFIPFYGTYKLYKIYNIPGILIIINIFCLILIFINKDMLDPLYLITYFVNYSIAKKVGSSTQLAFIIAITGPFGRFALSMGMNSGKDITKCPICNKITCDCKICKVCNKKIPKEAEFCPECGNSVL